MPYTVGDTDTMQGAIDQLLSTAQAAVQPQAQQIIASGISAGLQDYRKYLIGTAVVVSGFMVATLWMLSRTMSSVQRCK